MTSNPHTEPNQGPPEDNPRPDEDTKDEQLDHYRSSAEGKDLRTNQGVRIADNHNSLKTDARGATLMEDFIFREKLNYLQEAFKHLKVIAALADGRELVGAAGLAEDDDGVILGENVEEIFPPFFEALSQHRVWSRNDRAGEIAA